MAANSPLEHIYDLSRLSDAGDEVAISADAAALRRLAEWLDVESVQSFAGTITLARLGANRYRYDAVLACQLTQSSIVSLDPIATKIEERFSREFHVQNRPRHTKVPEAGVPPADADDDLPEELESPRYDLAAPLLEELSLALDPYPRAPGEDFEAPQQPGGETPNPFAVLKKLKDRG
ncbi:MAG TPA: DUF177 domain-containing protein [Rhizomicrobium sp.]|nr:DUF177 domain-containing protein [Rhizomicrobium sp.]